MNQIRTFVFLLGLFTAVSTFGQVTLTNKVYESGSKTHFDNYKKCEFYFECDCCSGKLLFTTSTNFMLVNYCTSDFVVTKGTYKIADEQVTLNSDGSRIDVKYNWEREVNPEAEPAYFVNDSTIAKYQLNYRIDNCERTMLVNEQANGTFIAIETELSLADELEQLRKYKLTELLKLK